MNRARIQSATAFIFVTGLLSVAVGLAARFIGIQQIAGHDPVLAISAPVIAIGLLWTLGVVSGLIPIKETA
jgi:hypothetical protein